MFGTRATASSGGGLWLGTVTRLDAAGAYVEVPRLAAGYEYGPARYPAEDAGILAAGDDVVVAFLEDGLDELVVLVRLS